MKIKQLLNGLRKYRVASPYERAPSLGKDEVPDPVLHTLRRQRQDQMNQIEKRMLREQIKTYQESERKKNFYGQSPVNPKNNILTLKTPPKRGMFAGRGRL